MREQLEGNINSIVDNLNRLYEDADTARKVVTRKLAELADREKNIKEPVRAASREGEESSVVTPEISPTSPELKPLKPLPVRENGGPSVGEGKAGGQSSSSGARATRSNKENTLRKPTSVSGEGTGLEEQMRLMRRLPTARNRYRQ